MTKLVSWLDRLLGQEGTIEGSQNTPSVAPFDAISLNRVVVCEDQAPQRPDQAGGVLARLDVVVAEAAIVAAPSREHPGHVQGPLR